MTEGSAPDEPPTVVTAPVGAVQTAPPPLFASSSPVPAPASQSRPSHRFWRALRVVVLVVLLPLIALGIGILIAYIAHAARANNATHTSLLPTPSSVASATPSASASPSPRAAAVPADWITEDMPPTGLTFRHPPGWVRRTAAPEVLRFEPVSPGSLTPGVEGVGAGFEQATDPALALRSFAARVYGSQPAFVGGAVTPVTGHYPDEQQQLVTYTRAGASVRVVLRSFRLQGHTVLVIGRSLSSQPIVAARLASQVEASLKFSS